MLMSADWRMAEASSDAPLEVLRQLSKQSSEGEGAVTQEIELLQCVYLDELQLTRYDSGAVDLQFHVTPSTGEDVAKQYIYLDLHLVLSQHYPEQPAEISISACRGLSDARLKEIVTNLGEKASSLAGVPMVYELVEEAKESLTANNLPSGDCVVCLHPFREEEVVTRTDCYHYFHVPCLNRYLKFYEKEQQELDRDYATGSAHVLSPPTTSMIPSQLDQSKSLECPVCREPIAAKSSCLEAISAATPTHTLDEDKLEKVHISQAIRHWQQHMARLLRQQEEKGGLIDTKAKDQVIDETWVRPTTVTTPTSGQHLQKKIVPPPSHDVTGVRPSAVRGRGRGREAGNRRKKQNRTYDQQ